MITLSIHERRRRLDFSPTLRLELLQTAKAHGGSTAISGEQDGIVVPGPNGRWTGRSRFSATLPTPEGLLAVLEVLAAAGVRLDCTEQFEGLDLRGRVFLPPPRQWHHDPLADWRISDQ